MNSTLKTHQILLEHKPSRDEQGTDACQKVKKYQGKMLLIQHINTRNPFPLLVANVSENN